MMSVDKVVLLDTAQYTKNDWRNRNRIRIGKIEGDFKWLTIPVHGSIHQSINNVKIADDGWSHRHCENIRNAYGKFEHFDDLSELIRHLENLDNTKSLSEVNENLITFILEKFGIYTPLLSSADIPHSGSASEKLLEIATYVSATTYVTAPAAKNYLDIKIFTDRQINVKFADYGELLVDSKGQIPTGGEYSIIDLIARFGWSGSLPYLILNSGTA